MAQLPRSVLILSTSYPTFSRLDSGIPRGKFVHELARSLVQEGVRTLVLTHRDPGTEKKSVIDGVEIHRFRYFIPRFQTLTRGAGIPHNIATAWNKFLALFYFTALFFSALRLIHSEKPDWINAHWAFPTGWLGGVINKLTGKPLVITVYGADVFPFLAGRMPRIRPYVKSAILGADLVAGISIATVEAASKLSGRSDIRLIPDGINVEYYRPGARDSDLLRRYGVQSGPVIFFTGRMVERKGHRFLLEAVALSEKIPDLKLILGGDGPLRDSLQSRLRETGLQDRVFMPGPIPEKDLVPLLRSADLYVLPSCIDQSGDMEGSPTAALEALSCGTPALISDVGGNRSAVREGYGALYFESADAQKLAERIEEIFGTSGLLDQLRAHARDEVLAFHSCKRAVQSYLKAMSEAREG